MVCASYLEERRGKHGTARGLTAPSGGAYKAPDFTTDAMATDATQGTFDDLLALASPRLRPVCASLRQRIASLHKGFVEVVWPRHKIASFGTGPRKMTEHYAYIAVHGSHVNLGFYHGVSLPDPTGILQGAGEQLRHVKIQDVSSIKSAAISALLRAAIAERKLHASKT